MLYKKYKHLSKVRHYETILQFNKASRRHIIICCMKKKCIYKMNGLENRSAESEYVSALF